MSLEIPHYGYSSLADITELQPPSTTEHVDPNPFPPSRATPRTKRTRYARQLLPAPHPAHIPDGGEYIQLTYRPLLRMALAIWIMGWPPSEFILPIPSWLNNIRCQFAR
ncbi:hypothetical protein BKA70DRAFT_1433515 [Coprinopsis sp. MPI-PUGE-AT-0042]|nr:hypothetical protein BKA70DRAFT_1433515 [Coprinopsis sp. MPI-PUGE-AT-0042]